MESNGILAGRLEAVSFLCEHMQQNRAPHVANHLQVTCHRLDVVSIHGTDVAETHLLEQHATVQEGLDRILKTAQHLFRRLTDDRNPI